MSSCTDRQLWSTAEVCVAVIPFPEARALQPFVAFPELLKAVSGSQGCQPAGVRKDRPRPSSLQPLAAWGGVDTYLPRLRPVKREADRRPA